MLSKTISRFLYYRPRLEAALSQLDKTRLRLPTLSLARLFADFDTKPISFYEVTVGPWSTPLFDVAILLKIAICTRPKSVLELGSYRGYTALALVRHLDPEARLVALDSDPRHGEAYRNSLFASQIERRVGWIDPATFANDAPGSFDLIFLDADHSFNSVKHDTEITRSLLSNRGYFLWHDYANWGKFSRKNGVPEYLHELSQELPVARIAGSWLAVYSPTWQTPAGAATFRKALVARDDVPYVDPWASDVARG